MIGKITIASIDQVDSADLNDRITQFFKQYPGVELEILIGTTADVIRMVELGTATLGLCDGVIPRSLTRRELLNERFGLYCGAKYHLAGRRDLVPGDLRGEPFVGFTFDALNRRATRTNPLGQTMAMGYDGRDNLVRLTREDGVEETATYDGLSRRITVTAPDNTISFAYDPSGNLVEARDDDSAFTVTWDNRHRVATIATDGSVGPQPAASLTYAYDQIGRRLSVTDGQAASWTYGFDEKSQLESLTAPWGDVTSLAYDPAGRRVELSSQSGRLTRAAWSEDRLAELEHFQDGTAIARSGFDYADDGAVRLLRDLEDPAASETLTYDAIDRLIMVARGTPAEDGGTPIPTEDYAYDPAGNRTAGPGASGHVVDDHNRLLETSEFTYAYDDKGNRTARTRKSEGRVETFSYNAMNQLVGYDSGDGTQAAYAYDALGRRIAKTVNGVTTAWVHDVGDMRDVTTHDALLEFENGTLSRRWLFGARVDEPLGFEAYTADTTPGAGTAYALHADRQGSIIAVTDQATGTIAARYSYDAFGQREVTLSTITQDYGFTGREYDAESGLYHYRARHYDPTEGRFVQSDPLGFAAGDLNLFAYTWNNPANWTDPSGLTSTGGATTTAGVVGMGGASGAVVGQGARCVARKIATALTSVAMNLAAGREVFRGKFVNRPGCRTGFKAPKCRCAGGGAGGAAGMLAGSSSFAPGTEVLTPTGKVAIETLREGDLVVARDEETGQSGVFPVTAVMSRQAVDLLWVTLESEDGTTTRLGVTSEHPMFVTGQGWTAAGEVAPGDTIRNADLAELRVLAVAADTLPTRVHNLEIASAHTYFAGELEAWGHNAWYNLDPFKYPTKPAGPGGTRCQAFDPETGKYVRQVYEGTIMDFATGVVAGASGSGAPPPDNDAGSKGNTCGSALGTIIDIITKF